MTILMTRVVSKNIRTYEKFQSWVLENVTYIVGSPDLSEQDARLFALNVSEDLVICIRNGSDQLRIRTYSGEVSVTYYEYIWDEVTDKAQYHSLCVETFPEDELESALECFMQRWNSDSPHKASTIKATWKHVPKPELTDVYFTPTVMHEQASVMRGSKSNNFNVLNIHEDAGNVVYHNKSLNVDAFTPRKGETIHWL